MTNRMILQDPMLGQPPADQRGWTGLQRQLAEDTAPGFMSRVLLADQTITAGAAKAQINNLTLPLVAGVRYLWEIFFLYTRTGTADVQFDFDFTGNVPASGDRGIVLYRDSALTGAVFTPYNPFNASVFGTNSDDGAFSAKGFFSCTTKGILSTHFSAPTSDGNDATVYSGSYLKFQPIMNLAYESNP